MLVTIDNLQTLEEHTLYLEGEDDRVFNVLQITDSHLGKEVGEKLCGLDTDLSFDQVISMVQQQVPPDLLIATGDLANHGALEAYQRLQEKLSVIDCPKAWLPGNHDVDELMIEAAGESIMPRLIRFGRWAICQLNSSMPNEVNGKLGKDELQSLGFILETLPQDCYIVICLHHQPVPMGSEWIDKQKLADSDLLFDMLKGDQRFRAMVWGHVHQEFCEEDPRCPGAKMISTPSTCIQFAPDNKDFKIDDKLPGYRNFEFFPDGTFKTDAVRLDGCIDLEIDYATTGY